MSRLGSAVAWGLIAASAAAGVLVAAFDLPEVFAGLAALVLALIWILMLRR